MLELLAENMLLIVGLVAGALMVGLKAIAKKTDNTLDDKAVVALEKNKDGIVAKIVALILSKLKPEVKAPEPKEEDKSEL